MQKHGKQWALIKAEIPSRTAPQIRTHAQKFFLRVAHKVPPGSDVLDFLRTKPASYFVHLENGQDTSSPVRRAEKKSARKSRDENGATPKDSHEDEEDKVNGLQPPEKKKDEDEDMEELNDKNDSDYIVETKKEK